jgi:uncharacterized protein (TIGR02118 family)
MIKMVVEVWKKPDMTDEAFSRRWLVEHGALVKKHAKVMGFVRYVQSHKQQAPAIVAFAEARGWTSPPDGLTEVWWDSAEAMNAALGSDAGKAASAELEADERQFCDTRRLSAFLAVEETIFDYSGEEVSSVA